jgi:hypothetical protein
VYTPRYVAGHVTEYPVINIPEELAAAYLKVESIGFHLNCGNGLLLRDMASRKTISS